MLDIPSNFTGLERSGNEGVWFGDEIDDGGGGDELSGAVSMNITNSTDTDTTTIPITFTTTNTNTTNTTNPVEHGAPFRPLTAADFATLAGATDSPFRDRAPLDLGLSVPPPTTLRIGLNDDAEWTHNHTYYPFGGSETITINAATDNVVDAARVAPGAIRIYLQPEWFGAITAVCVNGTQTKVQCAAGCMLTGLSAEHTYNLTVGNAWGGAAHRMLPPHPASATVAPDIVESAHGADLRVFAVLVLVIVMGWTVVRLMFDKKVKK